MSRYNQLSPYCTTIGQEDGRTVVYPTPTTNRAIPIVSFDVNSITLRSGGWQSVATKRKMNQASHQFGLGYSVSQKDFHWSVTLPDGSTVDFEDGMTFARHPYALSPEASEYNRDLALRMKAGQVGSGMKIRA
jgi:hypothetical protein